MIVIFTVFRSNDSFARIGCTLDCPYKSVGPSPKRSISYCKSYVFKGFIVIFIFVYFLKMRVANKCAHRLWQISILNFGLNKIFLLNKRLYCNHFFSMYFQNELYNFLFLSAIRVYLKPYVFNTTILL